MLKLLNFIAWFAPSWIILDNDWIILDNAWIILDNDWIILDNEDVNKMINY